ncbi:MAG: 50S ribosomal protein L4 [Chlorobi bacterium]|nr:50S ribosomal protein L4 [Chlorobiota bacterium]
MKLKVYSITGEDTGRTIELSDDIFGIEPNEHAIYLDVKQYLANQRQGTHKAKERGEVAGSTKKIKRQKGTGTARAGSIKNPLFRGGGRVFGPRPRNYGFKLNKKLKRLARKSALSAMMKEGKIKVVEDFDMEAPKTKEFIKILKNLEAADAKSLIVLDELKNNVYLSSRNLPTVKIVRGSDLNTYVILNTENIILSEPAVAQIEAILKK